MSSTGARFCRADGDRDRDSQGTAPSDQRTCAGAAVCNGAAATNCVIPNAATHSQSITAVRDNERANDVP
jgi:hypothetical protein